MGLNKGQSYKSTLAIMYFYFAFKYYTPSIIHYNTIIIVIFLCFVHVDVPILAVDARKKFFDHG